jgi:hypothetical protein
VTEGGGPHPSPHEPPGSIIERFRGTEWGTPEPPPPPPPPRRRGPLVVILAFVAGIVALVAVVLLAPGLRPSTQPGLGPFLPVDGPTPRVPDSIRVLEDFWSTVRDPELTYHLEGRGEFRGDFTTSFELSLDIQGDNFTGTVNTIGGSGMAEIIRLDGVVYARLTGEAWISRRTSDADVRQEPFMGLSGRRELAYDAPLVEDGVTLHRLVSTDFYRPSVARMLDLGAFRTDRPNTRTLEVVVTDEGVPLRATFTLVVEGSAVDGLAPWEGEAEYTFTNVGLPVVVATPAP